VQVSGRRLARPWGQLVPVGARRRRDGDGAACAHARPDGAAQRGRAGPRPHARARGRAGRGPAPARAVPRARGGPPPGAPRARRLAQPRPEGGAAGHAGLGLRVRPPVAARGAASRALVKSLLTVALGGALGSVARYAMSSVVQRASRTLFPVGTLSVNALGCFL